MTSDLFPIFCPGCDRVIYGASVNPGPPGLEIEEPSLRCPYCDVLIVEDDFGNVCARMFQGFLEEVASEKKALKPPPARSRSGDDEKREVEGGPGFIHRTLFLWF